MYTEDLKLPSYIYCEHDISYTISYNKYIIYQ